jgi:D-serine deaminase-like pyridoxal phosphate-dependent protein
VEEAFYWVTSEAAHAALRRWPNDYRHLSVVVRDIKQLTPYAQIAQPFRVTP